MGGEPATPDQRVLAFAARQDNVIGREQALRLGLTRRQIDGRIAGGAWRIEHRAVYRLSPATLSVRGLWIAALLALGDRAVLSHTTALAAWDLARASKDDVHVTVPRRGGREKRRGIVVHRSSTFSPDAVVRIDGLSITSSRRTLADCRPLLTPQRFAAVVRQAEIRRLDVGPIRGLDERLAEEAIRRRFDRIVRRRAIREPRREVVIDAYTVDYLWDVERVIVELDGRETHDITSAFESDRIRDARMTVLGFRTLRFTWRRIDTDPGGVGDALVAVLGAG